MRIAVVSTAAVAVPPPAYGGTEEMVHDLTEGLVRAGHDVTLFATGDSRTSARLRFLYPRAVWPVDPTAETNHASWACAEIARGRWDVVHVHQPVAVVLSRLVQAPFVYTLHHVREDRQSELYRLFPAVHYVAISARQRELETPLPHVSVIYHGVDAARFPLVREPDDYVSFIGRFAPEKAPHLAIEAARRAGVPLRLAGRPHPGDGEVYHAREIAPRLDLPGVTWIGEVGARDKAEFLGRARAMLLPSSWEEPFGLVTVESMLTGTPVVAFARGSAPEIIDDGVTGVLVSDVAQMAAALPRAFALDRGRCRARALERFHAARMVDDYLGLYRRVRRRQPPVRARAATIALRSRVSDLGTSRRSGGTADKPRRRHRQRRRE